jgi:hypothetical protein
MGEIETAGSLFQIPRRVLASLAFGWPENKKKCKRATEQKSGTGKMARLRRFGMASWLASGDGWTVRGS